MAKNVLAICLMFLVASSVIYEAQGTFLLKMYLRKKFFPRRCTDFTPFASKGILMLMGRLQGGCPATREFKEFFGMFQSYMAFISSASASSRSIDTELTTKCDGLAKAMSVLTAVKGRSSSGSDFKETMLSMGKTLIEQKRSGSKLMTFQQKKELVVAMVKWTRMLATFVKSAAEKRGKSIDISNLGLDVDVNSSVGSASESGGSTESGSSSTNTGTQNSGSTSNKDERSVSGTGSATSSRSGSNSNSGSFSDTTGTTTGSPSGSPTGSPSGSTSVSGETSVKGSASGSGGASSKTNTESTGTTSSSTSGSSTTSVKQVESETSKELMSFISSLEKKYAGKVELKVFFDKLKTSMSASSKLSNTDAQDFISRMKSSASRLSEAMIFVRSKFNKSAEMKTSMETCQEQFMKTLKELQDINSKIVSQSQGKTVTSTQQTELKQTITKWEQVTTQFVETAASSSSSSSSSSQSQQVSSMNAQAK